MQKNVGARLMFSAAMVIFGTLGVFTRNIDVTSGELALYVPCRTGNGAYRRVSFAVQ